MLTLLITLLMHPVHASLSEVQWNEQTHSLEVSLRLSPEDARWILETSPELPKIGEEKFAGGEDSPPSDDARRALRYLAHRYTTEVHRRGQDPTKTVHRWIGEESRSGYVWWHFEIIPDDQQPPDHFYLTLLLDREPNYKHRMVVLGLESPTSLDFMSSQFHQEASFWKR